MKTILLFCLLAPCTNVFSQSILSDTRDAANMRTITSGSNPLHKSSFSKTMDVQSQLNIQNDSITSYDLNFTGSETPALNSVSTCSLQTENGTVLTGALVANKFRFSKEDFYTLITSKITQIKITATNGREQTIQISEDLQDILSKQAEALLERMRANN